MTPRATDTLYEECRLVLEYARTIYPGISQISLDTDSDNSGEEDEIETIVDSLFNLSPLLLDILENIPGDIPTGFGYVPLFLVFLFLLVSRLMFPYLIAGYSFLFRLVSCLMLLYMIAGYAGWFQMLPKGLRRARFD